MKKIKAIVFDLDNTLIGTEKIKDLFYQLAMDHGCSEREAREIYINAREKRGKIKISLESFGRFLELELKKAGKNFSDKLFEQTNTKLRSGSLLFSGVRGLLGQLMKKEIPIYLLSLGVREWQEKKIKWAGLDKFFPSDNIIFTDNSSVKEGKAEALKRIFGSDFNGTGVVLVNDKPDESEELLEMFPRLRVFLRQEVRDKRYKEIDFARLERKYKERVVWCDSLRTMTKGLK